MCYLVYVLVKNVGQYSIDGKQVVKVLSRDVNLLLIMLLQCKL